MKKISFFVTFLAVFCVVYVTLFGPLPKLDLLHSLELQSVLLSAALALSLMGKKA